MDFYNEYVLVSHLESALTHCENVIKRGDKWNFRCNICGDSKKSKSKRRGWVLKNNKGVWIFNCFNECGSMGALFWLKKYFPEDYKNYIMETLSKQRQKEIRQNISSEPERKMNPRKQSFPFLAISSEKNKDIPLIQKAIQFCTERKIPESIWRKFFVCEKEKYAGRLIIPFYNEKGKVYAFQARTLNDSGEKYISSEGEKRVYNIYNVDRDKPVMVTEGMIDSMFLENAIAIVGLKMSERTREELKSLRCYFLLDYDEPGQKVSVELLNEGKWVFNWYKFQKEYHLPKREKWDVNEVFLYFDREERFSFAELEKYFTNSILDTVYFK